MAKEVYWHLPGFCVNFYLYQVFADLMEKYPEKFNEGYKIGSVYGTFPSACWNGGRAVFGNISRANAEAIIDTYDKLHIPVRFTWTNSEIKELHLKDIYCNGIMRISENGNNQVLCNSEILENYLRKTYPNFKYVSSTTKRIKTLEALEAELEKDYFMAVLDYDLNHDEEVLKALEPKASKVEILVDEICYPNCPKRLEHYKAESVQQLLGKPGKPFDCPNIKTRPAFSVCKERPTFISREELPKYIDRGFENFKLVGRGLPEDFLVDSLMYYFVKDEECEFIKGKLMATLKKIRGR